MPRVARFRTAAIDELCRQLQFAPRETRLREMEAAERLLEDVDPGRNYPRDFVVYRITGYRPDGAEAVTLVGAALIADLATLIQHLSAGLDLPADHAGRRALAVEEVAGRLGVSTKTVQRYRRDGLVFHYAQGPDREPRLSRFEDALDRFARRNANRVRGAHGFTRVGEAGEDEIVEAARRLCAAERISLNEAARRIARTHGRAHETIRGILQRHDRGADAPLFREHGPLTERDARLIHRAWRRGVALSALARRFDKTAGTIRRALGRRRADLLRRLDLQWVELPTFDLDDAETVILAAPPVAGGLDALLPSGDALALIEAARAGRRTQPDEEQALAAGYNMLKRRARRGLDALPARPAAALLDAIETDLRWATRLKRRLVSLGLPHALLRIEQNLHRPLPTEPTDRILAAIVLARDVSSRVAERLDPARGQRLDRLVAYETDRALARLRPDAGEAPARRAAARHEPGSIPMEDVFRGVTPWEDLLEPRRDLAVAAARLDGTQRAALEGRYGLCGTPPLTAAQVAQRLDVTPPAVARLLRTALVAVRSVEEEA